MKIINAKIENYSAFLIEKYRPPSKGGNTKALHSHVLTIEGEKYSFLALGTKQWAYKSDTVSFEYNWGGVGPQQPTEIKTNHP